MAHLTHARRQALADRDGEFAIPEKAPGSGSYPIEDKSHAEAALRLRGNASPGEQKRIVRAVKKKFPGVGKSIGQ